MSAPRSRSLSDSVCPSAELLPVLPDRPDSALDSTPITQVRSTSAPVTPVPVSYACSGGRDTSPAYSSAEQKSRAATCSDFSEMLRFLMVCPTNRPT